MPELKYADLFNTFQDMLTAYTSAVIGLHTAVRPTEELRLRMHDCKVGVLRVFNEVLADLQKWSPMALQSRRNSNRQQPRIS